MPHSSQPVEAMAVAAGDAADPLPPPEDSVCDDVNPKKKARLRTIGTGKGRKMFRPQELDVLANVVHEVRPLLAIHWDRVGDVYNSHPSICFPRDAHSLRTKYISVLRDAKKGVEDDEAKSAVYEKFLAAEKAIEARAAAGDIRDLQDDDSALDKEHARASAAIKGCMKSDAEGVWAILQAIKAERETWKILDEAREEERKKREDAREEERKKREEEREAERRRREDEREELRKKREEEREAQKRKERMIRDEERRKDRELERQERQALLNVMMRLIGEDASKLEFAKQK
ncbi:hypothetical protein GUITHDRAFT_98955 [Guillardia theta CCMP2712]|uniref:Uncharacterized protein n=1 Tax=Guillardia theta (strain CCMP2712) TaxID=905079 RepID=L1K3X2_GUITC|nr:hypothetical protein GUITHDRAFT_98955 [Guillardia theta CCMP2712]EKX55175.1 hypothetical protein GUITHDRAFT_98955 [Guillardia theta CCMP2712]|eukprot:XP_005842155.1 hypothetical protein GUITHDRAFT_98955 [Guillardia theta CCMP2712]